MGIGSYVAINVAVIISYYKCGYVICQFQYDCQFFLRVSVVKALDLSVQMSGKLSALARFLAVGPSALKSN